MRKTFILAMLLAAFTFAAPLTVLAAEEAKHDAPKAEKHEESKKDTKKEGEGEESKKGPADVSGGRFAGDPVYVHLAPMILPVITDTGVEQIVTLQITIQVRDFDSADIVHSNMPKVMDSLMRYLYGGLGNGDLRNGALIDVTRIKSKCIAAVGEAIGPSTFVTYLSRR